MRKAGFIVVTIIVFLFLGWLLFANLSDHYLWNDEASGAVLSRNVLEFGYPSSFDGLNYHYPDWPEFNWPKTHIWIVDPWIQNYLMVLSFISFGITTWSARLPFVIAGFLTLVIIFIFCIRYLGSTKIALISILLMGTSVPFLLHTRQARYYGLVIFLEFTIFFFYSRVLETKKGYVWLALASTVLSLTHHVVFIPIFGGIWLAALFYDRKEIVWRRFIFMSILPMLTFLVWLGFSWVGSDPVAFPLSPSLLQIKKNFEFQIRTINGYFVPVAFWIITIALLCFFKRHQFIKPTEREKKILVRMAIVIVCNIIMFSFVGLRTMRYYVQYLPFLFIIEAFFISRIFQLRKALAIAIVILLIFTNFLSRLNPLFLTKGLPAPFDISKHSKFRTYFLSYLYELTHEYTGPLEALCNYLDSYAMPGDRIKIIKGDLTVMFYHPELVILNDARYFKKTYPEWIVIRKYWNPIYEDRWKRKLNAEIEEGYLNVLDRYEKVALPAVDSIRENEPDNLETHFFRSPNITAENQIFVYRLR